MSADDLPKWITERVEPGAVRESRRIRWITVRLKLLPLAALVAAGVYTAFEFPAVFHLATIGIGAYVFVAAIFWPLRCTRLSVSAFAAAAVAANLGMASVYVYVVDEASGLIAVASTLLFTGAIGLLLVARTRTPLSLRTKISLQTAMVTATLVGPVMYISVGPNDDLLGDLVGWLLLAAFPFLVLTFGMSIVLLSYHESEQTLPSDKWI